MTTPNKPTRISGHRFKARDNQAMACECGAEWCTDPDNQFTGRGVCPLNASGRDMTGDGLDGTPELPAVCHNDFVGEP